MSNRIQIGVQRTLATVTMVASVLSMLGFAALTPATALAVAPADYGLKEGDVIRATGDIDLYIVNQMGYKRLFVNPAIFNLYGHLSWSKVKEVSAAARDAFMTSGLFRNCETGDQKVYGLDVVSEDVANLRWVNTSGAQAVADDSNFFKKVFCINTKEAALYGSGAAYTSVLQVPSYSRGPGPGPTPSPSVTGNVNFSANANNGGSIISGAAQVPVLNFHVMNAASGAVMLDTLKFTKSGVVSDSNISNAYISVNGSIVSQYTGLSGGVLSFQGTGIWLQPGQGADLTLRVDVSSGTSNGNTVGFNLNSASDVKANGATIGGSFPIVGGTYTTTSVTNPSLATISSLAYTGVASQVDAGSNAFRGGAFSFSVNNNPVKVQSVRLQASGSVNFNTDLKNAVLRIDGQQVGTTGGVDAQGYLTFNMTSNPPTLNTGSHQAEVYLDVLGTPNRNFTLQLLRPYDWLLWDSQYNTNISGGTPTGTATSVSVRQGTSTANLASDTPTGNIALGSSNITIAKFRVYAAGEGLRVKWFPFKLTETGSVTAWSPVAGVDADIRNISLQADDGSQVGTTINTPSSCTYGTPEVTATTYICSFGSSSSNVNYIIPANTARVFSLKVDLQSTADLTTLKGSLLAPASTTGFTGSNFEGQISFQTGSLPAGDVDGSALTVSQSPFQGAQNSAVGTQTFVGGVNQAKIGSYSLSASSAEGVNVTSVTLLSNAGNTGSNLKIQNLKVKAGSTEWNYSVPTITASTSYTYSSPSGPTLIPAGGSVVLDVYADILTGSVAGTYQPGSLTASVGVGASTNTNQTLKKSDGTTVASGNPVVGQAVTISGAGSVTVTQDNSVPPSQDIVLGATNIAMANIRFQANNVEDIRINTLNLVASVSAFGSGVYPSTLGNLRLYDSSGALVATGTALVASSSTGKFTAVFNFGQNLVIAKNTTRTYTLKSDVSDFSSSPNSHKKGFTIQVTHPANVQSFGNSSNLAGTVLGLSSPISSNTQRTLRTKLTAALATAGAVSARARAANDDIGTLTLNVDPTFGAQFASVSFKLSGAALPPTAPASLQLVDNDTGLAVASTTFSAAGTFLLKVGVCGAGANITSACPNVATPFLITAGTSKIYKVRVDSSTFANGISTGDSLSVQIQNAGSLEWQLQGGADENLYLQAKDVPITFTVSYE